MTKNARVRRALGSICALVCIGSAATPKLAEAQIDLSSACNQYAHTTSVFFGIAINGNCTNLSHLVNPTGNPDVRTLSETLMIDGSEITINAMWDEDPFITFGATTTNLVAGPVTYAFLFGTPIVPGVYNFAQVSVGLSVTGGLLSNSTVGNSGIYPTFASGYGTLGALPTNLGVDAGTGPCVGTEVTNTCDYGPVTNSFSPALYDNLEALLTYTQTDLGSVVSFTGRVDLLSVTVPEPSTYALMAIGLGVLGIAARRRRSATMHLLR
jgi:hypothetical protein